MAPWDSGWRSPVSDTAAGLVLDFAGSVYGAAGVQSTLGAAVQMSRPSPATRIGPTGQIEPVAADLHRLTYDPTTLVRQGLLLEAARTNLIKFSDAPATQTVSIAAVSHSLSFYGSGTVTLSGAHSQTVTGTGSYPVRTNVTFTPTAGILTLTIAGSVSFAQLEVGDNASSYLPTAGVSVSRVDDIGTVGLGNWYNPAEGTIVFHGRLNWASANDRIFELDAGATSTRMSLLWNTVLNKPQFQVWNAGALQAAIAPTGNSISLGSYFRVAIGYHADNFAVSLNGSTVAKDTAGIVPAGLSTLRIGRSIFGAAGFTVAKSVVYYPVRLSDAEIEAVSA